MPQGRDAVPAAPERPARHAGLLVRRAEGEARRLRLEIAADYLVIAAWLAFLKSKLLLPAEPSEEGEPTGAELAALLAFRLKRLDAMRQASAQLMTRKRLGRDIFARGLPQPIRIIRKSIYGANVYDLLKAYSSQRQRGAVSSLRVPPRMVWSLKEARGELERLLGMTLDWAPLDRLLAEFLADPGLRRTALASSFTATVVTDKVTRTIRGTVFGGKLLRIIEIDGFNVEVTPSGTLVVIFNADKPGVIGSVGTVCGKHGINISTMGVGQKAEQGQAILAVSLDKAPDEEAAKELAALDFVNEMYVCKLD